MLIVNMPTKKRTKSSDTDGPYLLKLVLYVILGSQWLWITTSDATFPLPLGLLIGFVFASHEHFQIDRKIEYAVLLIAALVAFWGQVGVYINL